MRNKRKWTLALGIAVWGTVGLVILGCGGSAATLPNPAAEKCVRDGFTLEPMAVDGVPRGHLCVNPRNGKKCEVWAYYRGECNLGKKDQ